MKIRIDQMDSSDSEDYESAQETFAFLEEEIAKLEPMLNEIDARIEHFKKKIEVSDSDLVPASPEVEAWCIKKGLSAPFRVEDWAKVVFQNAKLNLEERTLTFEEGDPWGSSMTVFALMKNVPKWFRLSQQN